jgi:hypothetical protein
VEKHVSKGYGGYIIYEVDIPAKLFTTSFHPKKSKVVRITPDNKYEYVKLSRKPNFIAEMTTRNIIGIDATNIFLKHAEASPPEGYIWSFKNIKIKKIEVVKL